MCPSFESRCKLIYITTFKGVEYTSKALHLVFYPLGGDILSENKPQPALKHTCPSQPDMDSSQKIASFGISSYQSLFCSSCKPIILKRKHEKDNSK